MPVKRVPPKVIFECDVCGTDTVVETSASIDRPPGWAKLTLERGAVDYQGREVADASVRRLLCGFCQEDAAAIINGWAEQRRKKEI